MILIGKFATAHDERILHVNKGVWVCNNPLKNILKLIESYYQVKPTHIDKQDEFINKFIHLYNDAINKNIKGDIITGNLAIFKDKPKIQPHIVTEKLTKKELAYITDLEKAVKNDNYNRNPIINQATLGKKSRVLDQTFEKMDITNTEVVIPKDKLIIGAITYGYDSELVNSAFNDSILLATEFTEKLEELCEHFEIDKETAINWRNEALKEICK